MPSQASAQRALQPLVSGTEGPPAVDIGSVMPFIAAAPASSFMHEVSPTTHCCIARGMHVPRDTAVARFKLAWLTQAFDGIKRARDRVWMLC